VSKWEEDSFPGVDWYNPIVSAAPAANAIIANRNTQRNNFISSLTLFLPQLNL
jgi:hypothetical protein